MGVQRFYWK